MSDPLDEHPMNPINQESYDDWTHPDDEQMSEQPKEYSKATAQYIDELTAALAAEAVRHIESTTQHQLAAEREHHKQEEIAGNELARQLNQLRDQLELDRGARKILSDTLKRAQQQLAAEREKVKALVDALEAIRDNGRYDGNHLASIARDVLAKVKEVK